MKQANRRFVRTAFIAAMLAYLTSVQVAQCQNQAANIAAAPVSRTLEPKNVSFYEVPLVCPAAPQIGCGSASKPLLLELERSDAVSEAWLNRAGTLIAVVWLERSKTGQRFKAIKSIFKEREMTPKELTGGARQDALESFQLGTAWYRGAEVDRLSEEEASVIAARWIRRVREKVTLTDEKAKILQDALDAELKRQLTGQSTKEHTQERMLEVARQQLDQKDIQVLVDSFGKGFRTQKEQ
jgi:hypothetical protein